MKKKYVKRLFALGVCTMLLTACGNSEAGTNENMEEGAASVQGETEAGDTAEGEKKYSYKLAMYNNGPWHEPTESLEYYKELFPDMDIELQYIELNSGTEKLNLMISSGETPDVMQFGNRDELYAQGVLGCWTEEFFREHAPNISKIIDETDPAAWDYAKYDGENMYTIPGWNINRTYPIISVYNKTWLDAVGETVPETLEDAERVFYKFANEDPDGNGKKDTYGLSEQGFMPIYGAFGMQRSMWLEDENGKLVYGDVMPEAKEALRLLNKWYEDGIIDPEFITGEAEGGSWKLSQPLNKGKIGYTSAGWFYHWSPAGTLDAADGSNVQEFKALNPNSELTVGVPLVGPDGKAGHKQEQPIVFRTHFSKELCEDTERFARLLEFIDYVNGSDKAGDMNPVIVNTFGEEGTEWEWETAPSGKKIIKQLVTENNEMGYRGWTGTFHFMEEGGSLEFQALKGDKTWIDEIAAEYPESYVNKLYGKLESAGEYQAELDKLLNEGYIAIILGEEPIEYFDEMVEMWYEHGGQILTDEANEWYASHSK